MAITPMPIVILLSGNGTNAQAIIDATALNRNVKIAAVISDNPEAYGLVRARNAGIPTCIVDRQRHPDRRAFDSALLTAINQFTPELIVLAGFMRILGPQIVQRYPQQIINIHPSLLPKYPGLNTHQRALDNQDIAHGVSVHWVTEELDAGPVIAQAALKINPGESALDLQQRIHAIEHKMYPQVIQWLATQQALVD